MSAARREDYATGWPTEPPDRAEVRLRHPRNEGEPIDTPRAFIGEHASFYDEKWRWMEWQGRHTSWNAAAALALGFWAAFRKLYGVAAGQLAWVALVAAWLASGGPWLPLLLGWYGNWLYYRHFLHVARRAYAAEATAAGREQALRAAGGTSSRAVVALGLASAAVALAAALLIGEVLPVEPAA
jgi:hypothetical protein